MGVSVFFYRFEGDNVAAIPYGPLSNVLYKHGLESLALQEGLNDLYPYPVDETAIGEVRLHVEAGTVKGVSIGRPGYNASFRAFSFELISEMGMVMITDWGGGVYASTEVVCRLPEWLTSQRLGPLKIVQSAGDLV